MKKRKTIKIDKAESMNNGIIFRSRRFKGYASIATINNGEISTQWTKVKDFKKAQNKHKKNSDSKEFFKYLAFVTLFSTLLVNIVEKISEISSIWGTRTYLIGFLLIILLGFIFANKKGKTIHRFHSAEHMVLNAYRDLKRVPSIEEISNYSRFSKTCGTNMTTYIILSILYILICSFAPHTLYGFIIPLIMYISLVILLNLGYLNFLQYFSTRPATITELLVAIEGMNTWLENEKKEKQRKNIFTLFKNLLKKCFN